MQDLSEFILLRVFQIQSQLYQKDVAQHVKKPDTCFICFS